MYRITKISNSKDNAKLKNKRRKCSISVEKHARERFKKYKFIKGKAIVINRLEQTIVENNFHSMQKYYMSVHIIQLES